MTLYNYTVIYNPISDWVDATDYFVGNKVLNNSSYYECILDHTSNITNDPGTGGSWPTFWVQIFPTSPNTDITKFIETIKDTEIGSGEVRSLSLRLNANRGAFITNTNSGATPIIDQFDKILISITDRREQTYSAAYEVDVFHPTKDGAVGTILTVDLLGSEFYLQKTLFADQFFFKSMFDVSKGIADFYNKNKGTKQVTVTGHDKNFLSGGFNELPAWTANDYTFNLTEKSHYDGELEVIDRGGSSVAAGGAGDFFELGFNTNSINVDQIDFRGFSSGNPPDQTSIPNISNTLSVNPAEQEGDIEASQGTVTGTWCADSVGTLPRQNADFIGALEAWRLFPTYVSGETYPQDAIILVINTLDSQGDSFHYKANKDTSIAPPTPPAASNADWDQYQFTDFLQNEVNYNFGSYSFWTDAKALQWQSNGAKTNGNLQEDPPTDNSVKVWDSNQVKIDGIYRETWVDVRATNPAAIPTPFIRNGGVYRGFRVLVDGEGTGAFSGFDDNIIQWNGNDWIVFLITKDQTLVGVDEESRTYQYQDADPNSLPAWNSFDDYGVGSRVEFSNVAYQSIQGFNINNQPNTSPAFWIALPTWQDITTLTEQANDVYHSVYDIYNSQGHNDKDNGGGGNFGQTAAVTYEFRYERNDSIFGFGTPSFYRQFAGVNFRAPYPFNSNNGNSIGNDYGDSNERLPATFEAENMGLSSSGLSGFNNPESEDLGPFDALTFFIKHEWRYNKDGSGATVLDGNFSYRCALYDIDDTVVIQDFVIPFNNLWESVSLPIGGFSTYKARAPWAFGNASQNIFLQQLEILNSFRWRNIKKIAIHWLGPYDDEGRYQPWGQIDFLFPSIIDPFAAVLVSGFNVKLSVDSFQWAKPGLSLSPPNTERPLQPQFFYEPLITNKYQNDQANLAKLEITKFRHKGYEITGVGLNDIRYGDSFFLENPKLVNDEDRTTDDLDGWVIATDYILNDDTNNGGTGYRCILDHTSASNNQPGVGANWTDFWDTLPNPIPNTIKLVAKKIDRLIDKTPSGPGGYLRTITGVRRFKEGEQ